MTKSVLNTDAVPESLVSAAAAVEDGQIDKAAGLINDQTIEVVRQMAEDNPSRTDVVFLLAMVLWKIGQERKAEEWYKKLLECGPNAAAYDKLGCLCQYTGRMSQAAQYHRKAVETEPDRPELWANLARVLMETGEMDEGINLLRKAVERMPQNPQVHSNLLFRLHQMPALDPKMLFDEHKRWSRLHAPADRVRTSHNNSAEPDRRLRVGYISPDFRRNSVAYFFEPLLDGHDRQKVEVYGYGNVEFHDQFTERLKDKFDYYRNIRGVSDEAVVESVERDRIDILVDLAGHVGDNRLGVMAYKPAPVQVTYLGYPDTTGVQAIDYRLTDALADLPQSQEFYTEELVFLPDGFLCYRPADFAPPVASLPADAKGYITFGSFNNNCKINAVVAELWAEVLKANSESHLLLKLKGGNDQQIKNHYFCLFERFGISRERIDICGWKPPDEHLNLYGQVDIALDTYPYNGATTTCEALWMGVPTISLVGNCHACRVGLSILTCVGLDFFATSTPKEYIAKATALAANRQALAKIRASMRARIAASGLCYAKGSGCSLLIRNYNADFRI
jgi:predicted O-linked N-acetylglucosamine transferase (SPINDLY family)